jgi:hypothetical protein
MNEPDPHPVGWATIKQETKDGLTVQPCDYRGGEDRDRGSATFSLGTAVIRASALGNCVQALQWSLQAATGSQPAERVGPPPMMQVAMEESADLESDVLEKLKRPGVHITDPSTRAAYLNGVIVTGTTDALEITKEARLLEVKTVGSALFEKLPAVLRSDPDSLFHPKHPLGEKYRWQATAYELLYRHPLDFILHLKADGELVGEPLRISDWVRVPRSIVAEKLRLILDDWDEEISCTGKGDWCEWENMHQLPVLSIQDKVNELLELQMDAKQLQAQIVDMKAVISHDVREMGGRAVTEKGTKLTWVETHVREENPREYDRKYLKITPPKGKK